MKMNVLIALFGSASAIKINKYDPATDTNSTASGGQYPATGTNSTASGGPSGPQNNGMSHPFCATKATDADYATMPDLSTCPSPTYMDWVSGPGTTCMWACNGPVNNGPPNNGPPVNQGPDGTPIPGPSATQNDGMATPKCATGPDYAKNGVPADLTCPSPTYIEWNDGPTGCVWGCNEYVNNGPPDNGPPVNYGPPSPQDQANGFVDEFYQQCDADSNALLTRKEIKDCIKKEIKQKRKEMKQMMKFQKHQMKEIAHMVWKGASAEPGVVVTAGVSRDNIVSWATANWSQIEQVMWESPPMMDGPNGEGPPHNGTAAGNSTAGNSTAGAY